jgi:guanosine-3',5'-bis(diphosphate) 3'-pyrophosphohydrolase
VLARQLLLISTKPVAGADEEAARPPATAATAAPVLIRGTEGMAMQMANCCHPIPGDQIVGQLRRDLGLLVHQSDCLHAQRARRADPDRWLDLQWADEPAGLYGVDIEIRVVNERGVLGHVAVAIADADSNILNVHIEDEDARVVTMHFKIQVRDRRHLARVMRTLRQIRQVARVTRARTGARATGETQSDDA